MANEISHSFGKNHEIFIIETKQKKTNTNIILLNTMNTLLYEQFLFIKTNRIGNGNLDRIF